MNTLKLLTLIIVLSPLLGSLVSGLSCRSISAKTSHVVTIGCMLLSFLTATCLFILVQFHGATFNGPVYTWALSGDIQFDMGFLIDRLTAIMMMVVTFVSLLVHIYSIGYMKGDPHQPRFFSYVSLFTFAMLVLVTANNFFQLFLGWEGVGLVSYLLIGFWFHKPSAASGSLKAFLVNRVGDFGFILGLAAILDYCGSLDYAVVFQHLSALSTQHITIIPGLSWSLITVVAILLFIGAMGKSAQVPLHIWLPESMEGPTPISALIHAATMVTAGIFMVTRLAPLFTLSPTAMSVILIVGATGALFLGLLAFVENDIKRVIAYSTMSQLGYMMAANGAAAFQAAIFHLTTHAAFKALLFLSAGSVIVALHHHQDLRKMGNLKKYLPVTYVCFLIGALALSAIPPFSGFYSKDAIIEAVHLSHIPGAGYAYVCLLMGSFVTAFYIFRAFFMAFHTTEKMDPAVQSQLKESHWTMLLAMIALAIPSVILGGILIKPMLFTQPGMLDLSLHLSPTMSVMTELAKAYHGALDMAIEAGRTPAFWSAISGIIAAWVMVVLYPKLGSWFQRSFACLHSVLINQYGIDRLVNHVFCTRVKQLANWCFQYADLKMLDHTLVNGAGRGMSRLSILLKRLQSGYLYHYAFIMVVGLLVFLLWMIW